MAVGTAAIITLARLFTTNQDLLRRCDQDKKRLKELIREAKREKDQEAVATLSHHVEHDRDDDDEGGRLAAAGRHRAHRHPGHVVFPAIGLCPAACRRDGGGEGLFSRLGGR